MAKKKKITKKETENKIKEFFSNLNNQTPKEVKKIKKLAMAHNLKLKEKRKKFCKKCLTPYTNKEKIRINKGVKSIICKKCKNVSRWKI